MLLESFPSHPLKSPRACGDAEAGGGGELLYPSLSLAAPLHLITPRCVLFVCLLVDANAGKHFIVLYQL